MDNRPLVSIIIPNYNRAHLIPETLDSILKQTYKNWEVIIVDDGSTDNSQEVINNFVKLDSRIKFFERYRFPKGAQVCRNIGLEESAGKYIIFLDSDDCLADFCLEQRVKVFEVNEHLDLCVFPSLLFEKTFYDLNILFNIPSDQNVILRFLNQNTPWIIMSPIWKKESLIKNDIKWDEAIYVLQDYYFHILALLKGLRFEYFNIKPDSFWRRHTGPSISKGKSTYAYVSSLLKLFNHISDLIKSRSDFRTPEFNVALGSSYLDIIHRSIKSGYYKFAYGVANQALFKSVFSARRSVEVKLYIFLMEKSRRGNKFSGKIIQKLFYWYWGRTFFNKSYGTVLRV